MEDIDFKSVSLGKNQQFGKTMEPVLLTEEQIKDIIDDVPVPPGVGKTAKRIAKEHMVKRLTDALRMIKLYPVEGAFEKFKDELLYSLYSSHVESGLSVGVAAAVSLGGPITQLSLNTFHFAGAQSGVALAFEKIRDFLTGSRMNREPQMKVYFRKSGTGADMHDVVHEGTFESILARRHHFEQITVKDLVNDSHILQSDEVHDDGVIQLIDLHANLRPDRFSNRSRFDLNHVLKLELDTYRMYTHRITMKMVSDAIEGPSPADSLTCVWESQFAGHIYVLVDGSRDYGQQAMSQSSGVIIFLQRGVIKRFGEWRISGIENILAIEPRNIDVLQGIYRVESSSNSGEHYVYTNNHLTRWYGVSLGDIKNLLDAAGFRTDPITDISKKSLFVKAYYNGNLREELERRVRHVKTKVDESEIDLTPNEQQLLGASSYWYMETRGDNMNDIAWRDDIDVFRTISNDSHEISDMFGIDAARIFLIFRFRQTLQNFSSYVNGRHISLVFDLLTNLGIINSLSYAGINRRRPGPLTMASYVRSLEVFINSATLGSKQSIVGVSAGIYTGQRSKIVGTGAIPIEEDLFAIPQDRPTEPTIDEEIILDDVCLDENIIDGDNFAKLLMGEDVPELMPFAPAPINKSMLTQTSTIADISTELDDTDLLPSGARLTMASGTLMRALEKVTPGTGLEVSPLYENIQSVDTNQPISGMDDTPEDIPDITEIEDISDLRLVITGRYIPAVVRTSPGELSQLERSKTVSNTNLPKSSSIESPAPIARPLTPTTFSEPIPVSPPTEEPEILEPEISEPAPKIKGTISDEPVPTVAAPPRITVVPAPPRSIVKMPEADYEIEEMTSPGSVLDLLPYLSDVSLPPTEREVPQISITRFMETLSRLK